MMKFRLIAAIACCTLAGSAVALSSATSAVDIPGVAPPHFVQMDNPGVAPPHFVQMDNPGVAPPNFH